MDPSTTNPGAAPTANGMGASHGSPGAPGVGGAPGGARAGGSTNSTPEQRAKWRERWQRRKERILASVQSAPGGASAPGGNASSGVAPVSSPGQASPTPGIPWTPGAVKPVFQRVVPYFEKIDVRHLRRKAAKLNDPDFSALVESDAKWDEGAKRDLIDSGSEILADFANQMGLDAIPERYVKFGTAVGVIYASRQTLSAKLDELFERKYGKAAAPTTPPAAPVPTPEKPAA